MKMIKMITKEKFSIYEKIKHSGETNMFCVGRVQKLSGSSLTVKDILNIMSNYDVYKKQFEE